jgi:hypothetical protein
MDLSVVSFLLIKNCLLHLSSWENVSEMGMKFEGRSVGERRKKVGEGQMKIVMVR